MNISDSERREWAFHPVTQEFLTNLTESRQETMESWAQERYIGATTEHTGLVNAKALGGIRLLDQIIDLIQAMKVDNDTNN